jgi:hypothetical protein
MRPNDKGWFKDYLEIRKSALMDLSRPEIRKASHPEYTLYRVLQPTGLMYGQSVATMGIPDFDIWDEKEKLKILLTESLISSALLFYDKPVTTEEDLTNAINKAIDNIGNFYNNIFPELAISRKTIFGRKKSPLEVAEKVLNKRIEHASTFGGNFWIYFFHNSLLFLDVFIFGQWIHTNADRIVADFFRYEREELRFSVVKVIAAASHANKDVALEERRLYQYFVESTDLSAERRKEAFKIFEEGFAIEDINLPSENSWILKRFFLEVAILTIWADKKVEQVELDFLKQFAQYLGFNDDDLENSMISIEGFMIDHWGELEYLQDKQDFQHVGEQFIKRVSRLAEKNKTRLVKKIQENEEAASLMRKASSNELTLEEKEKVRFQLINILKSIPTFGILSLPNDFLTLPVLLKILPDSLFAEAIRE